MGYVPVIAKQGEVIKTDFPDQLTKLEYVKINSLEGGGTFLNTYKRQLLKGNSFFSEYQISTVSKVSELTETEKAGLQNKAKQDTLNYANSLINEYDTIAGYQVKPPSFAEPKDLVEWYRKSIIAVVAKLSDDAIKLGEDPNKVGKAVVSAGQTLSAISTTVSALASAGTALASIASVATPITAGIAVIVGALDALGVFRSDSDENKQVAKDYKQLSAVLQFWYEDYARAYAKLQAIDQAEFNNMLTTKYGSGSSGSGSSGSASKSVVSSFISDNPNLSLLISLFILFLIVYFIKR